MKESTGIVGHFDFITGPHDPRCLGWMARRYRKTIMNNRVIGLGRLSLYSLAPLFLNDALIPRVVVVPSLWIIDDKTTWIPFVPPVLHLALMIFHESRGNYPPPCAGSERDLVEIQGGRNLEREKRESKLNPFFKNISHLKLNDRRSKIVEIAL